MIVEKPLPRSHSISSSKRKSRDKFNPNPLNKHFSEQLKIPHGSFCYPNQYAKAKHLQHFLSIKCNYQQMYDVDNTSNGLTQLLNE